MRGKGKSSRDGVAAEDLAVLFVHLFGFRLLNLAWRSRDLFVVYD
jgi:hypothetical protein